jgi:hypothetical protein
MTIDENIIFNCLNELNSKTQPIPESEIRDIIIKYDTERVDFFYNFLVKNKYLLDIQIGDTTRTLIGDTYNYKSTFYYQISELGRKNIFFYLKQIRNEYINNLIIRLTLLLTAIGVFISLWTTCSSTKKDNGSLHKQTQEPTPTKIGQSILQLKDVPNNNSKAKKTILQKDSS